jgi:hypothetical protein
MVALKERLKQWYLRYVLEDEVLREDWPLLVVSLFLGVLILWVMVHTH